MQIITRFSIGQPVLYKCEEYIVCKIYIFVNEKGIYVERYQIGKNITNESITTLLERGFLFLYKSDVDVSHLSPVETDMDINYDELIFAIIESRR